MAKRPPERYEPGELKRTRNNLGGLSFEEAKQMSATLGGEIGVERSETHLQKKYEKLRQLNRRKSDKILRRQQAEIIKNDPTAISNRVKAILPGNGAGYFNRIRMNFLAAKSDHKIKTYRGAFTSLFSFAIKDQDFINPQFIAHGDVLFFRHIDRLVRSVRGLLTINQRHRENRIRNAFFVQILSIIKDWDIEGLHQELSHLQKSPRQLSFRYCSGLVRRIFGPIIRLMDLTGGQFIRAALKRAHDLNIMSLPKNHPDVERTKRYYVTAVGELDRVLKNLKFQCYPLLMKLACDRFTPYHSFYFTHRTEILDYLGFHGTDILTVPNIVADEYFSEPEEPVATSQKPEPNIFEQPDLQKGFEILERMFPQAGWANLESFPDMYPYFATLFIFPRGFELVPRQDCLQQIIILASILQELFYGFRAIEFGEIPSEDFRYYKFGEVINSAIDKWRQFIDELVAQHYLANLYEYCREIESNPRFRSTVFGVKQRDYLIWLKKLYILPHLAVGTPKPKEMRHSSQELFTLVAELCEVLSRVAAELADPTINRPKTVKNPAAPFEFEIESPVSQRFKDVMFLYHEEATNENLLLFSYSILRVLSVLLNSKRSPFYPYPSEEIYRRESADSAVPMYKVPALDPTPFYREADSAISLIDQPPVQKPIAVKDRLTSMFNMQGIRNQLGTDIDLFHQKKIPFTLMSLEIRNFNAYCNENGEDAGVDLLRQAASTINYSIREYKDVPGRADTAKFFIILPGSVKEEAVSLAVRLMVKFNDYSAPRVEVAAGVVQFARTWGKEKLIRVARQAAEKAMGMPSPSLCIYDAKTNRYLSLKEHRNT
ncbi:MAG: hypothetical protein CMN78_06645 [Spirochaetales bacterium]|nr:hypothetical protein [Spirochaetales bacterium]